ncbi:MAG: tetratricopeptide repeat protein [Anaerolineae bacterium]
MAERQAQPGQVILSLQAWREASTFFTGAALSYDSDFIELKSVTEYLPESPPESLDWTQLTPAQAQIAAQALQAYVPLTVTSRLNEQADWLAELRRITVVFAGIGGFDYEAAGAAERLQNFLHAIQEVVHRFEGTLNKVAVDDKGTVLLILFGAPPFSHEDDITRAVACALEMQTVATEQSLRMSIGIAEGGLFAGPVGAPSRREYTVIGDTVNLATRLMQHGRAGMIVINQRIKERAGSQFVLESMGQISVKGRTDMLTAYLVKGFQDNQDEFIMRYLAPETPLVGRECELEQLQQVSARVREQGLQILFIEGELGLGKSRLVSELVREWMMAGGVGFGCKGISYGRQIPYQAWREVLAALFGLTPALSAERRLARLAASIADLPDPPGQPHFWADRLPLLADVLGVDVPENSFTQNISGQLRRNNTFALIEALIRHQVKRRALLILLEDMHWADELSLALIAYLARNLAEAPLLLVLVHRPMPPLEMELLAEVRNLPYAHTIHLEPLTFKESQQLSRIFLGDKKAPPEVEEILLNRGQGNPFFLQEIAGAILDVAAKHMDQASKRLDNLNLPDTVQDVILTRVDRLSEEEKLTLKVASVIGPSFQRSLLSAAHPLHQTRFLLTSQLDDLEKEKLIRLEAPAPKWEYMFHNVVTQEVVYEGLLLAQRRQLHRQVGQALENLVPDEVEQLAFHYSRSDDQAKAIHYLKIAGDKARREYANQVAINYYSEILNLLASQSVLGNGQGIVTTEYWDTLLERAKLNNLIGRRDEAMEDLGALGVMAEALKDDYRRVLVTKQWANLYEATGDYDSALEVIERCVLLGEKVGQEKLVGEGYNQWGKLLFLRGEYETADAYLQRALALAQKHQDKATQADCLNSLGLVGHYQNDYEVALYFFEEALALWREIGDSIGLGGSLSNLGRVYYDLGQYTQAQQDYQQSLLLYRTIGDRAGEGLAKCNLGRLMRTLGNYPAAYDLLKDALLINREVGDQRGVAYALYQLAFLHTRLTEYNKALDLFAKALVILQDLRIRACWEML